MTLKDKLRYFTVNKEVLGLGTTLRMSLFYLLRPMLNKLPKDGFDSKYGVSTEGKLQLKEMGIKDKDSILYAPTHSRVMEHILRNLGIRYEDYVFVDLGCGKGKAVLMAMLFPFRKVIGVELASLTSNIARQNVHLLKKHPTCKCGNAEIACIDATGFEIPVDGDIVFYMYRPFIGHILQRVLDNISGHCKKYGYRILIAHSALGPDEEEIFLSKGCFKKIREYSTISIEHSWSLWECEY